MDHHQAICLGHWSAPLFFSLIALPFLEFADLAGVRCLLLEGFPLSDFVGLRTALCGLGGRFLIRARLRGP